jgi:hypothetical protein
MSFGSILSDLLTLSSAAKVAGGALLHKLLSEAYKGFTAAKAKVKEVETAAETVAASIKKVG